MNLIGKIREKVEEFLRHTYRTIKGLTPQQVDYLSRSSGKRIRALLLFALGKILNCEEEPLIKLGAAVELIHSASLYHDDIIDEAEERRGLKSAHLVFGTDQAVILGDLLYIKAISIATQFKNMRVIEAMAEEVEGMISGEMDESLNLFREDLSEEDYFRIINGKTARLFSLSASLPAILKGDQRAERKSKELGEKFGMAFQILDDVADIVLDREKLKKPTLSDLREGKLSLPYIYYLEEGGRFSEDIREFFRTRNPIDFELVRNDVIKSGAVERALSVMEEYLNRAREILNSFPSSPWRDVIMEHLDLRGLYGI